MSLKNAINRHLDTEISHSQPPRFRSFISDDVYSCIRTNVLDIGSSIISANISGVIRQSMYDGIKVEYKIKESVLKSLTS